MTKSTITREQLLEIIETDHVQCGEASYLARMALAAMDGEPVAEVYQVPNVGICAALGPSIRMLCPLEPGTKLYRHAQPAPVAPEEMTPQQASRSYGGEVRGYRAGWNACRAAMLQELKKSAGTEAICRSDENVQVLNTIKATPALGSLPKTDEVQNTNSPVIPDGYVMVPVEPNGDMLAAAQDAYGETDGDIASTLRAAMLAAAQQEGK
ncbi:hypothetical protein [Klebsiella pneumoniae]|uniref:hypothetical protein n=1 Tax=Klebsiella pneumoniae TaxID=573 RepID=UPI00333D07C4